MSDHLVNHILHPELESDSTLHVIGVVSNPVRYHSRYRLARQWLAEMRATPHVVPYVVETAFGDRKHELTAPGDPTQLQLRCAQEHWIKEPMINLGEEKLVPRGAKYICWCDMDVSFRDPNWALETIHQLQHFPVVQPWSDCADLGHLGNIIRHFESFGACHQKGKQKQRWSGEPYTYAHSGFAWACRRDFWENVKGLIDFAVLGSADHHMAWAMIGEVDCTIHRGMTKSFFDRCYDWQRRAVQITHKQVGFTPGRIEHAFHGPKNRRLYRERWQILVDDKYDPDKNLMYDAQGLTRIVGNQKLEQDIRLYNRFRHEDSIEEY